VIRDLSWPSARCWRSSRAYHVCGEPTPGCPQDIAKRPTIGGEGGGGAGRGRWGGVGWMGWVRR
jgi:hypothetical protein